MSNLFNEASLVLVPSGYKAGKVYSEVPTNGDGDLTFTRASSATRVNSDGEIEVVGSGVPRLDYSQGSCPALLLEPQRTNLGINTIWAGGVPPTSWDLSNSNGTISAVTSNLGTDATALSFANSGGGSLNIEYAIPYTATNYVISFYIESILGTLPYQQLIRLTGGPNIISSGFFLNQVSVSGSSQVQVGRFEYRFTLGTGGTHGARIGSGTGTTALTANTIVISRPQFEAGAYATSYIPTTSATVTRLADSFTRNNIYTNGLIGASGGTWFVELKNNVAYTGSTQAQSFGLGNNTTGSSADNFWIAYGNNTRILVWKQVSGTLSLAYITTSDNVKIAIKWNGTTADVFVNGVKVVSSTAFTATALDSLRTTTALNPYFIQAMQLYPTPLEDVDCEVLTGEIYTSYSEMATALGYTII